MQVSAAEGENASNPLAAVTNTDLRWQYLDLDGEGLRLNDYFVDGLIGLGSDRLYDWGVGLGFRFKY